MVSKINPALTWARLSQRIFNRALLIEPRAACIVINAIAARMNIGGIVMDGELVDMRSLASDGQESIRETREYSVANGVATIPVQGELVGRSVRLQPSSGLTGYSAIGDALQTAVSDQDVRGILLDIDSPGGELGARDLAERIRSMNTEKPIWALLDDYAASAAYYIASAADRIIMPQEGAGGSIGAIAILPDMKNAVEAAGIQVHVIRSGELKGKPLSIEGIDQGGIDIVSDIVQKAGDDFVKTVAAFRGITQKSVKETEAAVIFGRDMLTNGMVDEIMPAHEARQAFTSYVNRGGAPRRRQKGTSQMHGRTVYNLKTGETREVQLRPGAVIQTTADEVMIPEGLTVEQFVGAMTAAAVIAPPAAPVVPQAAAPAPAQNTDAALAAERTRIAQIVALPEAKGREVAALRLALMSPTATPEQAAAVLGAIPAQQATAEREVSPFEAAMRQLGNAQVGPDSSGPAAPDKATQVAGEILSFLPPEQVRRQNR